MSHKCHWPQCNKAVPPKMWGCKDHWFALPKFLRDMIWDEYKPGQEITKTPSPAYIVVADLTQLWIGEFQKTGRKMSEKEFFGPFLESCRANAEAGLTHD